MSIKSGFYNSINNDRRYNAEEMSEIFDGVISDGVFENVGTVFAYTITDIYKIKIGSGKAWFAHKWIVTDDAGVTVTFSANNTSNNRIDAIILEIDNRNTYRTASIKVKQGTASSNPQPPEMIHNDTVNQYPLYYVTIRKNRKIYDSDVTSCIGTSSCPYSSYLLDTTKALYVYTNEEEQEPRLPDVFASTKMDFGKSRALAFNPTISNDKYGDFNHNIIYTDGNYIHVCVWTTIDIMFNKHFKNAPTVQITLEPHQDGYSVITAEDLLNLKATVVNVTNAGMKIEVSFEKIIGEYMYEEFNTGTAPANIFIQWTAMEVEN